MGVVFQDNYTLPTGAEPLIHARIAHSGNWVTGGSITASSTAANYFAEGPDNSLTYERWKPTATTGTWENDYGSAIATDYCAIAAHNLGTQNATLQVQYYTGSAWADLSPSVSPADDMPIFFIFAPQTAQRFRINITASDAAPEIGVIKFGTALQMPVPIYGNHTPIDMARQTIMRSNDSETGEFLGRTRQRSYLSSSFDFEHLTASWVRTYWRPLQIAVETEPFFIAWRPATFSEVAFGRVDQSPIPTNMGLKDYMSASLGVRARGYD